METLQEASNFLLLKELKFGDVVLVLSAGDANINHPDCNQRSRIKGKLS
jgi:hypothetical protein